jgi:hypothetical protein
MGRGLGAGWWTRARHGYPHLVYIIKELVQPKKSLNRDFYI